MPTKFIRKGGRIIPIKSGGSNAGVKAGVKKAAGIYNKHFGSVDPIKSASKEQLFAAAKAKPGFLGYATQRVARATTKSTAKGLRFAGRGSIGVGILAATGAGTALYGAGKAIKAHYKKKTETQT